MDDHEDRPEPLVSEKILRMFREFKEDEERLIYTLAQARAKLAAPPGRYEEEDLAQLRAFVEDVERRWPRFKSRKPDLPS